MSLPRPADYVAPPAAPFPDVIRTIAAVGTDIVPYLARMARSRDLPSTGTAEGLADIRTSFARTLRRLHIELEVLHAERVPVAGAGGSILMWNQESHLDHLVLPVAIPRPFLSLYNNAIARFPFYGAHMRRSGHLHVDRTDETQWRASVARAASLARGGASILVSPEGTRSWDGKLLPMKRGAFILAESAAQPVVCVTVIGGHERLPRGSPFVREGRMRVVFSEPIPAASAEQLQEAVVTTFRTLKDGYRM